ncbi:hypothetical protein QOZ80_5BG0414070 [Eleusine coracana subsp. coracana]|nr:hypothetical protein QOZ80_5BG0414070 [Eleusine coracana subsp. coracana]
MATSFLFPAAPPPLFPTPCHRQQLLSPAAQPFQPSSPRVITTMVRWTPPPRGWFKLNLDGSVYNDGSHRARIRDSTGRVVLSFAEKTEHSTVGIVEARGLGLDRVVAEGDDLVLVQLLRGEETQTRIPVALQQEIVALLRCFLGRDVRHVYREGNQVAHTLFRQAYEYPGVWAKIEDDRRGVAHQRAVPRAA